MSVQVYFRRARTSDLLPILEIEDQSFEDFLRYKPHEMYYLLFEANSEGWVATLNDAILGYYILLFRKNSCIARLYSIAVAPEYRGKGVGSAMLQHAENRARKKGCKKMHLEVKDTNTAALNMYIKHGYTIIDFLQDYYREGMPAYRMEKTL
jgi:ribosomal-protein-alanine N-acetyltransferase